MLHIVTNLNCDSQSLTVGAARGSIRELFSKIKAIDTKHGKFELVLCVGDFFGPSEEQYRSKEVDELLNGDIEGAFRLLSSCPPATVLTVIYSSYSMLRYARRQPHTRSRDTEVLEIQQRNMPQSISAK